MFSKLKSVKKHTPDVITIFDLYNIVKNNPQKDIINNLRQVEYKSKDYNQLKLKLNCITPHGVFAGLTNDTIKSLSGYVFYDIDGLEKDEIDDTIKTLNDTFPISFIQKSVGGRGINFLIRYNDDTIKALSDTNGSKDDTIKTLSDTFSNIYYFIGNRLKSKGFNIDISAGGLSRKMNISFDKDVYINNNVYFSIDKEEFNKELVVKDIKKVDGNNGSNKRKEYILSDTSADIIPIDELLNKIKTFTEYQSKIEGNYIIDEIEFFDVRSFNYKIPDGKKRKTFFRMINGLMYINKNISLNEVYSYLFYINKNHTTRMMSIIELKKMTQSIYNHIIKTGEVKIKTKKKRIHFNKEKNLTKKQKINMANKINGVLKVNKSIEIIQSCKEKLQEMNELPTQSKVSKISGLSIATVKRHWNKQYSSTENIYVEDKNEIEDKIEVISEKDFFEEPKLVIEVDYKGIYKKEVEISKQDVRNFSNLIREIEKIRPVDESTIYDLSPFCKHKTFYLYDRYLSKQKINIINE